MTGRALAADALLAAGVLAELVCVVGVCWMRDVFDQLHYAAASTTVGPVLIGVAVALTGFSSTSATVETLVALAALVLLNPVLSHATARLAWRTAGDGDGDGDGDRGRDDDAADGRATGRGAQEP